MNPNSFAKKVEAPKPETPKINSETTQNVAENTSKTAENDKKDTTVPI